MPPLQHKCQINYQLTVTMLSRDQREDESHRSTVLVTVCSLLLCTAWLGGSQVARIPTLTNQHDDATRSLNLRQPTFSPDASNLGRRISVGRKERATEIVSGSSNRPVEGAGVPPVYAWYVQRPKNLLDKDNTTMQQWKETWSNSGYDPYILGVEDAMNSPGYASFNAALDTILDSNIPRQAEMRTCYLRYLAMASVGGGLMVDLDTTPSTLGSAVPQPNNFTLYCQTDTISATNSPTSVDRLLQLERQYGVPCLASGSAKEWLRVGNLTVWVTQQQSRTKDWTDMHSLLRMESLGEAQLVKTQLARSSNRRGWDACMLRYV